MARENPRAAQKLTRAERSAANKAAHAAKAAARVKRPAGRKRERVGDKIDLAVMERLAKEGKTDKELAAIFGVSESCWAYWKRVDPEFLYVLRLAKKEADERCEDTLLMRALGIKYVETTRERKLVPVWETDKKGKKIQRLHSKIVVSKMVEKFIPGDVGALMNWLTNRRPERWKYRQNVDVTSLGESVKPQTVIYSVPGFVAVGAPVADTTDGK